MAGFWPHPFPHISAFFLFPYFTVFPSLCFFPSIFYQWMLCNCDASLCERNSRHIKAACFVIELKAVVRNRSSLVLISVCFLGSSGDLVILLFLLAFFPPHFPPPPSPLLSAHVIHFISLENHLLFIVMLWTTCMYCCVDLCEWHSSVLYLAHSG